MASGRVLYAADSCRGSFAVGSCTHAYISLAAVMREQAWVQLIHRLLPHHCGFIVRKSHSADLSLRPKPASRLFFCSWLSVVEDDEAAPRDDTGLMGVLGCACTMAACLRLLCNPAHERSLHLVYDTHISILECA